MNNPFTPTYGIAPPVLVDRASLIKHLQFAVNLEMWAPGRTTLYTGPRGVGKTVMLNEAEDIAAQNGWRVISETAAPGLIDRLVNDRLPRLKRALDPKPSGRLTAVSTPVGGAEWELDNRRPALSLRSQLEDLLELLEPETGLMITIDEIQLNDQAEMVEFASVFQLLARREAPIAFIAAGLPHGVNELLNHDAITFLRRADRHELKPSPVTEAAEGISEPIRSTGRSITDRVALHAATATGGYPYLIQLVGYHSWEADPNNPEVTLDAVKEGIVEAVARLGQLVHAPALRDLSAQDRVFLKAMSRDDGPSQTGDIAQRMDRTASYVGQYRQRLLATDLIESTGHGLIDIAMPYLRDYLRARHDIELNPRSTSHSYENGYGIDF